MFSKILDLFKGNKTASGDIMEKIKKLAENRDEAKLLKLSKNEDPDIRAAVVKALRHVRTDACYNRVIEALKDEIPAVRIAASEVLGEMGIPKSNDALRYALAKDKDPEALAAIKKALLDIKEF